MEYYNKFRAVPKEAQKPIGGGRLKGMTDINPMWRIKVLTETFGPCGIGWKYVIKSKEIIEGGKDEKAAFVDIDLYYKQDGEWSDPIPGTGGSMFVSSESRGLYTNDECFKMALTDAISIAGKALGVGADIYFAKDRTKYTQDPETGKTKPNSTDMKALIALAKRKGVDMAEYAKENNIHSKDMTYTQFIDLKNYFDGLEG